MPQPPLADEQVRRLRAGLRIEGRESQAAAALARQGVKELVSLHQAIDATLAGMEASLQQEA
tara:strand:+ start:309 stop:494 length:186 start_codon:yes stop_codon:yes gene_type:complete